MLWSSCAASAATLTRACSLGEFTTGRLGDGYAAVYSKLDDLVELVHVRMLSSVGATSPAAAASSGARATSETQSRPATGATGRFVASDALTCASY